MGPSDEIMLMIRDILEDFAVPDTLGYDPERHSDVSNHLPTLLEQETVPPNVNPPAIPIQQYRPPILFRSDRSSNFPESPSTHSWHASQVSQESSLEGYIDHYAGQRPPVRLPLPSVSDDLPQVFQVYFYEPGSDEAVWSSLEVVLNVEPIE
ncbi:hypothetical protein CALCODRAFT_487784 [Calocera cornea HHB12733]|uniref:Uncharacterized protein n=1 Tax=Calocera cornea HHB12733 TaxID=1353952 RepID=A0A165CX72_9BASI|nr:hypothetical protein CALCODRAFT_487784 [Calocera cornea HHB12733]